MIQAPRFNWRYLSLFPQFRVKICQHWLRSNPGLSVQYFDTLFTGANPRVLPSGFIDTLDLNEVRTMPDSIVIPSEPFADPDNVESKTSPRSFTQGSLFPEDGDS